MKNKTCDSIKNLIKYLSDMGFKLVESKLIDYHFNEYRYKMKGNYTDKLSSFKMKGVDKISENTFACKCHWSVLELEFVEES